MTYSFIKPRRKSLFSLFTKIWLVFIACVIAILLFFDFFILYKVGSFQSDAKELSTQRKSLEKEIDAIDGKISFILRQKALAEEIYANNLVLRDSMKNLFDLVPDQITLHKVLMDKTSLVIYGTTPTKDTFNFLLEAPLKSIFHTSQTVFYLTPKGWYNFVSTNKILNDELFGEK
jgi:hypothetical protein